MIFQLGIAGSTPIHKKIITKSFYPRALMSYTIVWNIKIF